MVGIIFPSIKALGYETLATPNVYKPSPPHASILFLNAPTRRKGRLCRRGKFAARPWRRQLARNAPPKLSQNSQQTLAYGRRLEGVLLGQVHPDLPHPAFVGRCNEKTPVDGEPTAAFPNTRQLFQVRHLLALGP